MTEDATTPIDPNKSPEEIVEDIEAAEEAKNIDGVVAYLGLVSSGDKGGEEDWAEAAEAALDALYRLVKGGAYGNEDAGKDGDDDNDSDIDALFHLSAVFDCLDAWEEEDAIVEVGLGCVVAIASRARPAEPKSDDDDDDDDDAPFIAVANVLDYAKDFSGEATIQEQACLAIEGLALWKNCWRKELASAEGVREELLAARNDRITNERNKAYPVRAAAALGIELE